MWTETTVWWWGDRRWKFFSLWWVLMQATVFSESYCWGHDVCLISQLNIMEQTTSEMFLQVGQRAGYNDRVSNNLVDKIDLLALWSAEMLHIKCNCLTQCFTFSMIFLHIRMDWGKILSFNLGERIVKQNWAAISWSLANCELGKKMSSFSSSYYFPSCLLVFSPGESRILVC